MISNIPNGYKQKQSINGEDYEIVLCFYHKLYGSFTDKDSSTAYDAKISTELEYAPAILNIQWCDVKSLTYIDDIFTPYINGVLILGNIGGVYNPVLLDSSNYVIFFQITNLTTKGTPAQTPNKVCDQLIFGIGEVIQLSSTTSETTYKISFKEEFACLLDSISFKSTLEDEELSQIITPDGVEALTTWKIKEDSTPANPSDNMDIFKFLQFFGTAIDKKITKEDTYKSNYVKDLEVCQYIKGDINSLKDTSYSKNYFSVASNYGTTTTMIKAHITPEITLLDLLNIVNIHARMGLGALGYEPISLRSENLLLQLNSEGKFSSSFEFTRQLALRKYQTLFKNAFGLETTNLSGPTAATSKVITTDGPKEIQYGTHSNEHSVYEIFVPQESMQDFFKKFKNLKTNFCSKNDFTILKIFPFDIISFNKLIGDYAYNFTSSDTMNGFKLELKQVIKQFENSYLNKDFSITILDIPEIIKARPATIYADYNIDPNTDSGGGTINDAKALLTGYITGKMYRDFFTNNILIGASLPGQIYRKANELIYIHYEILQDGFKEAINSINTNRAKYCIFFVSRVIHDFKGSTYMNDLGLCSFAKLDPYKTAEIKFNQALKNSGVDQDTTPVDYKTEDDYQKELRDKEAQLENMNQAREKITV